MRGSFTITLLSLVLLLSSCSCHTIIEDQKNNDQPLQLQSHQSQKSTTIVRRKLSSSLLSDGPPSTEIDCSISPANDYEYYIERCYNETTQLWINGHCKDGTKEEVSELHRCAKSDGTRSYCHDCIINTNGGLERQRRHLSNGDGSEGNDDVIVKHVCGSDNPNYDEVCSIAGTSTAEDCGEQRLKTYSHQCIAPEYEWGGESSSSSSTSSWYLRESFYCNEQNVYETGPTTFTCGQEWYYPYDEDEHESGEEHPFANEGNLYCLDCGMAIQVCAGGEDDTCASLGLPEKIVERADDEKTSTISARTAAASTYYPNNTHRSAWITHGMMGAVAFGILIPSAIISNDILTSTYWMYHIHVGINIVVFTTTFCAVGLAVATMNGITKDDGGGGGHLSEMHHLVGLFLLLLVAVRLAIGFQTPEYLFNTASIIFIFALGAYQVQSGLVIFAKRYDTTDWGQVYLYGYVAWLAAVMVLGKLWMKWKERKMKRILCENMGIQMPDAQSESSETVGLT